MLQIEIAKGKGSYKPRDQYDTAEGQEAWANLSLNEGERARLRDLDKDEVLDRFTYEEAATMTDEGEPNYPETPEGQETAEVEAIERTVPVFDIPTDRNELLFEYQSGVVPLASKSRAEAWEMAIDAVNYPVHIVEAYYRQDGQYMRAEGETNTGRPTAFNLVVVDRMRTGEYNPIATVTDRYGSMPAPTVYADLKQYLDGAITGYKIREVYVSGDGGAQQLVIECQSNCLIEKDDLRLMLAVNTSSDGSTSHQIAMSVWSKQGRYRMPVPSITKKLVARHTSTLQERTINFAPSVTAMLDAWNDEIIPLLQFFADHELDREMAEQELDRVAEEAGVGKRQRSQLIQSYRVGEVKTSDRHSMFAVYGAVSKFVEDEAITREAADRWRYNLSKTMRKDHTKLSKKKGS